MSDEAAWFVQKGNNVHGPFTSGQLRQLAANQKITAETLVRRGASGASIPASKLKGLTFEAVPANHEAMPPPVSPRSSNAKAERPIIAEVVEPTNSQSLGWKAIAFGCSILLLISVAVAVMLPWIAAFCGLLLFGLVALWVVTHHIAIKDNPHSAISKRISLTAVGAMAIYAIILLGVSQTYIRANWNESRRQAFIEEQLRLAHDALENGNLDEALRIGEAVLVLQRTPSQVMHPKQHEVAILISRAEAAKKDQRARAADADSDRIAYYGTQAYFMNKNLVEAERTLQESLAVPMATQFTEAEKLANIVVAERVAIGSKLLEDGDYEAAMREAEAAQSVPAASNVEDANRLYTSIANQLVALQVADARKALEEGKQGEAVSILKTAVALSRATDVAESKRLLKEIEDKLKAEVDAEAKRLALQKEVQDKLEAEERRVAAAERRAKVEAESREKNEAELDVGGLVLLRETIKGTTGRFTGEITGEVVNRRGRKLSYAQITFNLYDDSGAQVGSALANINGLEPGGRWKFKATTFGTEFKSFKFSDLKGF